MTLVFSVCPTSRQDLIAGLMAVGIVERLEVIDIDQQQAEGFTDLLRLLHLEIQDLVEALARCQAGQFISEVLKPW